ncbi:hypothetical protein A1O3_04638 [Capronia epimyces CBS 606.96]|uniref:Major facilitator superfamily (MFS) profile domain-containing protein n=1 Tax=Capronia epimyces CBS 606.96 TaxID=1182542 RepID=W9Y436_9EURO|nr:uncharacterized protein A1O3_04638 [Capronia epimyces CBS 606.96]EXJ83971.1 hypothetical protein A1O3_04638 [Capronia epimyces CBS 606.96]
MGPTTAPKELNNHDTMSLTATDPDGPSVDAQRNPETDVEKTVVAQLDPSTADSQWDGPDDPGNPLNWPARKRNAQVIVVAGLMLAVNLASTMFAPAAGQLMDEFGFTSHAVASLTVSIYVLGFALGPLLWAPLSEMYGRLVVYLVSTVLFLAFLLGTAFAANLGQFMAFRVLSGGTGGASLALCGGTLADVVPREHRGKWMSLFVLGPLLGPIIGPVMGGFIAQDVGWRWVFRVIAIATGVCLALIFAFLCETFAPVLLRRKARARARAQAKDEPEPATYVEKPDIGAELRRGIVRPLKLLVLSPIVLLLSLYTAFYFGLIFLLFTTFSTVYMDQYGWSTSISGLSYLGMGVGMGAGLAAQARLSDQFIRQRTAKNGVSKPEDRLVLMAIMSPSIPIGMFWYGWAADKQTHWIVPILGTVFIGVGMIFTMLPVLVYLVDCFGAEAAASAMAANTFMRSIAGAFLPLAGPALYEALGLGWGNSLLGFLGLAMLPIPWVFYLYGEKIRLSRKITL